MRTTNDPGSPRRAAAARARTMCRLLAAALTVGALLAVACGGGEENGTAGEAGELSPAELGRLGGRIHQEPERAEEILAEAGLTAEDLEARVRQVTADPDASRSYAEGFREVAGEAPAHAAGDGG